MTINFANSASKLGVYAGRFYVIGPDIRTREGHEVVFANVEKSLTPSRRILRPG